MGVLTLNDRFFSFSVITSPSPLLKVNLDGALFMDTSHAGISVVNSDKGFNRKSYRGAVGKDCTPYDSG